MVYTDNDKGIPLMVTYAYQANPTFYFIMVFSKARDKKDF